MGIYLGAWLMFLMGKRPWERKGEVGWSRALVPVMLCGADSGEEMNESSEMLITRVIRILFLRSWREERNENWEEEISSHYTTRLFITCTVCRSLVTKLQGDK
jgi:hypothetical protein